MKPRLLHSTHTPTGHTCTRAHTHCHTQVHICVDCGAVAVYRLNSKKQQAAQMFDVITFLLCATTTKKNVYFNFAFICSQEQKVVCCKAMLHMSSLKCKWRILVMMLAKYVMAQCDQRQETVKKHVCKILHLQNKVTTTKKCQHLEVAYQVSLALVQIGE